ncbi:MAG: nucleoside phosphorylase [Desulfobacteraceae bacterium]|nr:nucleoside phosphorylase [Desulfobacteraceae bacterium]
MEQPGPFPRVLPDPALQQRLYDELSARELPVRTGTLWTTAAIYRENPKKMDEYGGVVKREVNRSFLK